MSTLKATNIKNESSASNNIVLDSGGGVVVSGVTTFSSAVDFDSNVSATSAVVGSAVTLSSGGITAGIVTATTGCIQGTLTAGTATVPGTVTGGVVCATSCFSGDGSGLSNIPSSAITGLSGGGGFCVFTSSGTFSVPPGTTSLKITAIGGGGSPQSFPVPACHDTMSGGGGAGSAAVKYLSVPPACSSYPVTVGGAGGDTVFGGPTVFLTEGGCAGCVSCVPLGGGSALGGQAGGAPGSNGILAPTTATYRLFSLFTYNPPNTGCCTIGRGSRDTEAARGGGGAPSVFGFGGKGGDINTNACPGCAYGAGGGGVRVDAGYPGSGTAGSGAPGFMIVEW